MYYIAILFLLLPFVNAQTLYLKLSFDDGTLSDSSGNARHGDTQSINPSLVRVVYDAERGQVLRLENGHLGLKLLNNNVNLPSTHTVTFWFNVAPDAQTSKKVFIVGDSSTGIAKPALWGSWIVRLQSHAHLGVSYWDSDATEIPLTYTSTQQNGIEYGMWYFGYIVHTAQYDTVSMRRGSDGIESYSSGAIFNTDFTFYPPMIGGWNMSASNSFTGKLDDIRIYTYELSVDEINTIFNESPNMTQLVPESTYAPTVTIPPTTTAPTTQAPTPTTSAPTTVAPTSPTQAPTTSAPTTAVPTSTQIPTTIAPTTTQPPTTIIAPTTETPTTEVPTQTPVPTTPTPTIPVPTTRAPTTPVPTTRAPTTHPPTPTPTPTPQPTVLAASSSSRSLSTIEYIAIGIGVGVFVIVACIVYKSACAHRKDNTQSEKSLLLKSKCKKRKVNPKFRTLNRCRV